MAAPVGELQDVFKHYGDVTALDGLNLKVGAGEVVALLGPNGAGKTTALSILLGQRKADGGTARLFGQDPREPAARKDIGATPQDTAFPENLKIGEIMALVQAHFAEPPAAGEIIERFELAGLTDRQVRALSGGERRRLAVALAFAGGPRAVFLDEPTTGLDVSARRRLWNEVRSFTRDGGTLFLTTHYLDEAEALATRVILIDKGRVIREGSVADIKKAVDVKRVAFTAAEMPELPSAVRAESDGDRRTVFCRDPDAAVVALVKSGVEFSGLEVKDVSLEDAVIAALENAR